MTPEFEARFWSKVRLAESGCWEWKASTNDLGYGKVWTGQGLTGAHVAAYQMVLGEIPDGLELDHLCRNPSCVYPYHLEPVTHRENVRRGWRARTHCRNGEHPRTPDNILIEKQGGARADKASCRECVRNRQRRADANRKGRIRTR